MKRHKSILTYFWAEAFLLVLFLIGCSGVDKKDPAIVKPPVLLRTDAFEKSLYAFTRKNCAECHGESQNPLFAQDNIEEAYDLSKNYINVRKVADSTFIFRTQNGHCGEKCKTDGSAMQKLLEEWKQNDRTLVDSKQNPLAITAQSQSLAKITQGFTTLEWKINGYQNKPDAVFQIEVQAFDSKTYRFRKPRITGLSQDLFVSNLHILLNGRENQKTSFLSVRNWIPKGLSPLLSASNILLNQEKGLATDVVSVAFEQWEHRSNLKCASKDLFKNQIEPILKENCINCHNAKAKNFFDIETHGECEGVLPWGRNANPFQSPLIAFPFAPHPSHPAKALNRDEAQMIGDWLQTE